MRRRAIRIAFVVTWAAMAASYAAGIKIAIDVDREWRTSHLTNDDGVE